MPKIVFVCYGNICRSPFAEHYARKRYQELGLSHTLFLSAGVGAVPGTHSPRNALPAAERFGVDLRAHRSVHVRDLQLDSSDTLIASDRHVFGQLVSQLGATLDEVRGPGGSSVRLMMQELSVSGVRPVLDVPDPMGQDVRAYLKSYEIIASAVDRLIGRLSSPT